jgi:hypothetical protein
VALPGAYAPTNIALQVIGARKALHDEAVAIEEERFIVVTCIQLTHY